MWNPFKRHYLVPIAECQDLIIAAMLRDRDNKWLNQSMFRFLEETFGIKRVWKNSTMSNHLIFDSEEDYTAFLLRLV